MAMRLRSIIVGVMLMTACEEVVDRSIVQGEPVMVVEGLLTNELTQHKVTIGWSVNDPDEKATPIIGASVRVIEGANVYQLTEDPQAPGEYLTPQMRAVFGRVYALQINYAGQQYVATDHSVPVEPLEPLDYREVKDGYTLTMNKSGQDPNYIRHEITWENTPECNGASCEGLVIFYDLKTIDVNEATKPDKENFVFPKGSTVVRKKYSMSPEYRSYLRAVLSETEWRGSPFDVERANVPTNVSNGAVGFFAVTTVTTDAAVVN